jgi:hypothetical protein
MPWLAPGFAKVPSVTVFVKSREEMSEIEETELLLSQANFAGVKAVLQKHLTFLKKEAAAAEASRSKEVSTDANADSTKTSSTDANIAAAPKGGSVFSPAVGVATGAGAKYSNIEDFAWDQGEYNSPNIKIYVDLPGVGKVKDKVDCSFGQHSFDLLVHDLDDKNYRLIKDQLEKDIVPSECKFVVKANKVVITLKKVKGEYSYETWQNLIAKKGRDHLAEKKKKDDPMGSINEMLKNMYDEGDESTKKVIAEAMMKSRSGEKPGADSLGNSMGPM